MLLNAVLSLTNLSAARAAANFSSCRPPTRSARVARRQIILLLSLSGVSSAAYHLCENAVLSRGLPGIGVSYSTESRLLLLDRLFAVSLACVVFWQFESLLTLKAVLASNADLIASCACSGILSEIPPTFYVVVTIASNLSVRSLTTLPPMTNVTLGCALLGCFAPADIRYIVLHGLWHILVYQSVWSNIQLLWNERR